MDDADFAESYLPQLVEKLPDTEARAKAYELCKALAAADGETVSSETELLKRFATALL